MAGKATGAKKAKSKAKDDNPSIKVFPTLSGLMPKKDDTTPQPRLVRLLEIDLEFGGGNPRPLSLVYTRCFDFAVTDDANFKSTMRSIVRNAGSNGNLAKARDIVGDKPIGNKMSVRWRDPDNTALATRYLVFRLASNLDWSFFCEKGKNLPPFTMMKSESAKRMFLEGGKFAADGTHLSATADIDECNYAYFIVDGSKLPDAGSNDYVRRFNIHVDLLERNSASDIVHRLPVIFDPDVRNPGGGGG